MAAALLEEFGGPDARESWRYSRVALRALEQHAFTDAAHDLAPSAALTARFDQGRVIVNGAKRIVQTEQILGDAVNAEVKQHAERRFRSMLNYALPKAEEFPMFELDRTVTPSPVNPLGVKGVGEAGAIASTAAVANAVIDALAPFGIRHIDMPLSPQRVYEAIVAAR